MIAGIIDQCENQQPKARAFLPLALALPVLLRPIRTRNAKVAKGKKAANQ
jgi:hypothetical protein